MTYQGVVEECGHRRPAFIISYLVLREKRLTNCFLSEGTVRKQVPDTLCDVIEAVIVEGLDVHHNKLILDRGIDGIRVSLYSAHKALLHAQFPRVVA